MDNEKNNLPVDADANENASPESVSQTEKNSAKKLPLGALIGIICGAVAVVVAVVLIILLSGNNKPADDDKENPGENPEPPADCVAHVDVNDDLLCDVCGASYDDGKDIIDQAKTADVSFKVLYDNGEPVSNFTFVLHNNRKTYDISTDENGVAKSTIEIGKYYFDYAEGALPLYCRIEALGFEIKEDTTSIDITVIDSTPNGTYEKPFVIVDGDTELTLSAGSEVFYSCRVVAVTYVTVNSPDVIVMHNGTVYEAVDGKVTVCLAPEKEDNKPIDTNNTEIFSIKNISENDVVTVMNIAGIVGSSENPEKLVEKQDSANVKIGETYYFSWISEKDGVFVLSSDTENGSLDITRYLKKIVVDEITGEESEVIIPILSESDGNTSYIYVRAGEEIKIGVSYVKPNNDNPDDNTNGSGKEDDTVYTVEFSYEFFDGSEENPVPVNGVNIMLSLDANASLVFSAEQGKTVTLEVEEGIVVSYNDAELTPDSNEKIQFELTESTLFTVASSDGDHSHSVIISLS